jgi:hypothetical protein
MNSIKSLKKVKFFMLKKISFNPIFLVDPIFLGEKKESPGQKNRNRVKAILKIVQHL